MTIREIEEEFPFLFEECFDFSVGDGWLPLVYAICEKMSKLQDAYNCNPPLKIHQIKEKFGTLRFYTIEDCSGELGVFIDAMESASKYICESCGKAGTFTKRYYIKVKCEECNVTR